MGKIKFGALGAVVAGLLAIAPLNNALTNSSEHFWMKIKAEDKFARSVVADVGVSIERIVDDYVYATGNLEEKNRLEKLGLVEQSFALTEDMMDFPTKDAPYHNYDELKAALQQLHAENPEITQLFSLGKTVEGRDIIGIRICGDMKNADNLPGMFMVGGHHAREHLSVDTPLRLIQKLLADYRAEDAQIRALVDGRDLHVVPALNADGLEYDIASGSYKMWRKNRKRNANGTYGVDLNRNYGFQWGTGGSSTSPSSDVYMGTAPFSEPETLALKNYTEAHHNLQILFSLHTFSKLILYPWGHKYDPISDERVRKTHENMARKMAEWNGYHPQASSELYIASGDMTDWALGSLGVVSFTFELDPANDGFGGGGFYPGAGIIDEVVQKNWRPFLYLLSYADNPYRAADEGSGSFPGL